MRTAQPMMDRLRYIRHRIAHRLHWQLGQVISATDEQDRVWVAFQCATCGEITSAGLACGIPPRSQHRI